MKLQVICAECGAKLGQWHVQGKEAAVEVHTCRCTPHILAGRATPVTAKKAHKAVVEEDLPNQMFFEFETGV